MESGSFNWMNRERRKALKTAKQCISGVTAPESATTLVPNLVRASAIPITLAFSFIAATWGPLPGAMITGVLCFAGAAWSIATMEETFGKDLDFVEGE